jgi:hypothetical protein
MIGSIEVSIWPMAIFTFSMVLVVAIASYNESRHRSKRKPDDRAP